jgi:hypothetical protein
MNYIIYSLVKFFLIAVFAQIRRVFLPEHDPLAMLLGVSQNPKQNLSIRPMLFRLELSINPTLKESFPSNIPTKPPTEKLM